MRFTITEHHDEKGKVFFTWELWCGPSDRSDYADGRASSVHQALILIAAARRRIDSSYARSYKRK